MVVLRSRGSCPLSASFLLGGGVYPEEQEGPWGVGARVRSALPAACSRREWCGRVGGAVTPCGPTCRLSSPQEGPSCSQHRRAEVADPDHVSAGRRPPGGRGNGQEVNRT